MVTSIGLTSATTSLISITKASHPHCSHVLQKINPSHYNKPRQRDSVSSSSINIREMQQHSHCCNLAFVNTHHVSPSSLSSSDRIIYKNSHHVHKLCSMKHLHCLTSSPINTSSSTRLYMSTPPPRKSYSSSNSNNNSSNSKRGTSSSSSSSSQSNNRNRGANAANHNRRGHTLRFEGTSLKKKKNTKRPPRWEKEGDKLYAEVTKQLDLYNNAKGGGGVDGVTSESNEALLSLTSKKISTVNDVCDLLEPWMARTTDDENEVLLTKSKNDVKSGASSSTDDISKNGVSKNDTVSSTEGLNESTTTPKTNNSKSKSTPPPFLWGSLPVGPVLSKRLYDSHRYDPTSVQRAAFTTLTASSGGGTSKNNKKNASSTTTNVNKQRSNAIIASPTGTGKTLAYLLPLLCTSPGGQSGEGTGGIVIVTPTIELAVQIQREVDVLWPPMEKESGCRQSSCFVIGAIDDDDDMNANSKISNNDTEESEDEDFTPPGRIILKSIQHSPIIAGTPKLLRMLYKEAGRIVHSESNDYDDNEYDYTISREERDTAHALVTNLRAIVLDEADRLLRTEAVAREMTERKQRKLLAERSSNTPSTQKKKQQQQRLVIARQTQTELLLRDLPIPSLDDVQIICASATIGRTMRRQLMQILDKPSADAAATLVTGDEDERVKSKDAERRKSVLLPEKLRHAYRVVNEGSFDNSNQLLSSLTEEDGIMLSKAERNDEKRARDTMSALWDTMQSLDGAKPIIIFPGRVGVERVQRELMARGLNDVRTLRNLDGMSPETDIDVVVQDTTSIDAMPVSDTDHKWKSIPVYIIGERFARGLDLPDVEYVVMLSPPSSAAGYAHMAGRTGRSGREGTAITLVRAKNNEVQRLAAIAEALGLKFAPSMSGVSGGGIEQQISIEDSSDESHEIEETISHPWSTLPESELKKKKNSELYDYIISCGKKVGRRAIKADLLKTIQLIHTKE